MTDTTKGKFVIDQGDTKAITLALGEFGYITQGDSMVLVDRRFALEISDKLAVWGAACQEPTP